MIPFDQLQEPLRDILAINSGSYDEYNLIIDAQTSNIHITKDYIKDIYNRHSNFEDFKTECAVTYLLKYGSDNIEPIGIEIAEDKDSTYKHYLRYIVGFDVFHLLCALLSSIDLPVGERSNFLFFSSETCYSGHVFVLEAFCNTPGVMDLFYKEVICNVRSVCERRGAISPKENLTEFMSLLKFACNS